MLQEQEPLGTGFGANTTAQEVLRDCDLAGKVAIVTGGHSGLGLETTRALAHAGASVLVAARRVQDARQSFESLGAIEVAELDLADLASVRAFADRFLESRRHVDFLIDNAGIMAVHETRVAPGWEAHFATNHLGHYALVNWLWPALAGGARVVAVSSAGHHLSRMRWDDIQFEHRYDKWLAYAQSKTANALFAVQLDLFGQRDGVRAFSVHPGKILTPLQRYMTREEMVNAGWIDASGQLADPSFKTPQQGAATQVWAATSHQLSGKGGLYCEDCDVAAVARTGMPEMVGVCPYAIEQDEAARLWRLSADLTGADAFAKRQAGARKHVR